jgi:hypothetical protein
MEGEQRPSPFPLQDPAGQAWIAQPAGKSLREQCADPLRVDGPPASHGVAWGRGVRAVVRVEDEQRVCAEVADGRHGFRPVSVFPGGGGVGPGAGQWMATHQQVEQQDGQGVQVSDRRGECLTAQDLWRHEWPHPLDQRGRPVDADGVDADDGHFACVLVDSQVTEGEAKEAQPGHVQRRECVGQLQADACQHTKRRTVRAPQQRRERGETRFKQWHEVTESRHLLRPDHVDRPSEGRVRRPATPDEVGDRVAPPLTVRAVVPEPLHGDRRAPGTGLVDDSRAALTEPVLYRH